MVKGSKRQRKVLLSPDDSRISRRHYLSMVSAFSAPAIAGCAGGEGGQETQPGDQSPDQSPEPGGTLQVTMEPIKTLDLANAGLGEEWSLALLVVEQLFTVNRKLQLEGLLVEDVSISDDGTVWTMEIQQGVQWHPPFKRELVAEDLVYNLDRIADPDLGSNLQSNLDALENWEAVDDHTLEFTFKQPDSAARVSFGGYRAIPFLSPDSIEEYGNAKSHPVGTGPFKFEEWTSRDHLTLSAFDDYWGTPPNIDRVVFRPITESSAQITELTTGNIDLLRTTPLTNVSRLQNDDSVTVKVKESGAYGQIHVVSSPKEYEGRAPDRPTRSKKIRNAIDWAIDRNAIVEGVFSGHAKPTQNWYPEGSIWHTDYAPFDMGARPDKARELIADSEFDEPVQVNMVAPSGIREAKQHSLVVQDNLNQAGFDARLENLETNTWLDRVLNFQCDLWCDLGALKPDPTGFFFQMQEGFFPLNPYWENPDNGHERAYELWDQGRRTFDTAERQRIYADLQKLIIDQSVLPFTYHKSIVHTVSNDVKNYDIHPYSYKLDQITNVSIQR